jgi:hypothetical protein
MTLAEVEALLAQDKYPAVRAAAAVLLGDWGQPQADFAEEPGPAMSPFADQLPAGKRRRALACPGDGQPG